MRFCGMCGASLTRTCPTCNFVNPVDYRFCGMCGTPLQEDAVNRPPASQRFTALAPTASSSPRGASSQQPVLPAQNNSQAETFASPAAVAGTAFSGERRVATVIFADVKGSTELLEKIGTEAWVEVMNNVFQVLEYEIYRYGGQVGQFRGDGLVAFFGAKSANEDDPEHAVLAALAMQEAIKPYASELLKTQDVELIMRVGVNTGDVVVANVGDDQYNEDTPMGEALTVASRMETAAEPGTVLISENTYRLVQSHFDWLSLGDIFVKGISHPISVFRPIKPKQMTDGIQDSQAYGFSHGLIGRKKEFQNLKKCVEDLYTSHGGIATITGVKGMGKSFLVTQVRQHFVRHNVLMAAAQSKEPDRKKNSEEVNDQNPAIHWLHGGRCRSYGHLRPYSMWLDLMHELLGTHPEDQAAEVQAILRDQVKNQIGEDVDKEYPNLSAFLSTPIEETATERVKHLDAEGMKRQFFETVRDWIHHLAKKEPLVISFADMQWADKTSLELLEYCLPLCDTDPILWILIYRPERDSPIWEFQHFLETNYPHRLTNINVPPLSKVENEEFISQFLGEGVLFPETRDLIIKKSEGNPYFIKELVYSLINQGALIKDGENGNWQQIRAVTSLDLPDSLQSVLMARIDRLSADERRVLQMAAVIGSVFWSNALLALAGQTISEEKLQSHLVSLQRAGFIHERALVEDLGMEYAFDSSLVREVSYESLLNSQRVAYHMQVAQYLEEVVFREGKRRYFNTLAHHYRLAGDIKKELFYTFQAAERAQSIYANAEALKYYTRAIDLLEKLAGQSPLNIHQRYAILTQKFEALNGRRAVYFLMGNVEEGWKDARELLPLARQMEQDSTWLIDALLQQPGVSSADNREELLKGVPLALEALDLAKKAGDKRREMNCLLAITSQRNLLNDPTWVEIGNSALALAREIGDRQYEAMILLGLGHAFVGRDEIEKGMQYLNDALPICKELDDRIAEMTLLHVLGSQYERSGDHYRRLMEFEQRRLEIARSIGDHFEEGNSLMFCGQIIALNLGDLEGGLVLIRQSISILEAVSGKLFPLLRMAQIQVNLGQYEDAQQTLEIAQPIADKNVYDLGRVGHKLGAVLLYNALGDSTHLVLALKVTEEILEMESSQLVSKQYRMAAACQAALAHLELARITPGEKDRSAHMKEALESSAVALETYNQFQFVNIIECSLEEVFLRHSQALAVNGMTEDSGKYLEMAYTEMMRKYEMIPSDSHYRRTYLENIPCHREIRAAHTAATLAKISTSSARNGTN
jgi:class 3 adenylate cyclase/tetratricopeptide (TPR) repeat protein